MKRAKRPQVVAQLFERERTRRRHGLVVIDGGLRDDAAPVDWPPPTLRAVVGGLADQPVRRRAIG